MADACAVTRKLLAAQPMTTTTDLGAITVRLDPADAPCTVASFAYLAGRKFFDGTRCHRLVTSGIYVLQCGDPSGTGAGGPGYTYPDENLSGTRGTYPAGTVAMANAGPNTNGSQFFIVYQDSPLPPRYTPFGNVTVGLDLVRTVAGGLRRGARGGIPLAVGPPPLPRREDPGDVAAEVEHAGYLAGGDPGDLLDHLVGDRGTPPGRRKRDVVTDPVGEVGRGLPGGLHRLPGGVLYRVAGLLQRVARLVGELGGLLLHTVHSGLLSLVSRRRRTVRHGRGRFGR